MTEKDHSDAAGPDPGVANVLEFLLYGLSLPERTLRTGIGLVGGALRESTQLLVPQAFQDSKTYSVMVRQMLDYLVEDIGGVEKDEEDTESDRVANFVARKAVGNFVEMTSLATFHLSPLLLLAVVSDVAYGSKSYLKELCAELKAEGVIDEDSTIDHVDDLLEAVSGASRTTSTAFDTPPLSVDGLRETIAATREAAASIDPVSVIPQAELARLWDDIHETALREGVSPLGLADAMTLGTLSKVSTVGLGALSSVRVAGRLFDRHVIDHYEAALVNIQEKGIYSVLAETGAPYMEAVWQNFSTDKPTVTEDLFSGKLVGQVYKSVCRWLGVGPSVD